MRTFPIALLALALGLAAGCGSNSPAKISGKVTYNGTPLKGGAIVFVTDKGPYPGIIKEDGSYLITDVPPGDAKVTVDTESLNPDKKPPPTYAGGRGAAIDKKYQEKMKEMRPPETDQTKNYVKIPAKYAKAETTELTYTIKGGKQTKDFELKD